jgi:hypothetical protein
MMDPNETLTELRRLVSRAHEPITMTGGHAQSFAESFEALDEWLSRGGFLPEAWSR